MIPSETTSGSQWFGARLEWLLVLTAIAVVVLVYPPRLDGAVQAGWTAFWARHPGAVAGWVQRQLDPFLAFQFSPLILKGVLAALPMIGFLALRAARLTLRPVVGAAPDPHTPQPWHYWLGWAVFFAWVTASGFWGPTPDVSRDAACWAAIWGVFGWVLLRRGLVEREMGALAATLMLCGVAVMVVLYLEAMPFLRGWSSLIFYRFEIERNVFGSLLGHNSAAASFLMMTAFPALALVLTGGRRVTRWMAAGYLAMLLPGVIILQSRAVWILGPLLAVLAARSMFQITLPRRRRWVPSLLLAAVALGLASQAIDRGWNPFFVRDNPLARRLVDLTPDRLLKESRLRLNYLGARLVPKRPIVGHGLYTFQYIYPRLQGEYFWEHPDSRLGQTTFRSHMAHDEYLQVAIEQGLVGLGLMGWMLMEIARRGWRRRRQLGGRPRLLHEAFGWSALGFALHGLVDFPFHVPQLALPGVACLAAWGAFVPDQEAGSRKSGSLESQRDAMPETRDRPAFRPAAFARLLAAMACLAAVPFVGYPFLRALQGDYFYNRANSLLASLESAPAQVTAAQRVATAAESIRANRQAVQLVPSNGIAWLRMADAYRVLGMLLARQSGRDGKADPDARERAIAMLKNGLAALDKSAEQTDFNLIYLYRAQIERELAGLLPEEGYDRQYPRNLEEVIVHYTPAMYEIAYELAEALAAQPQPDVQRIVRLRRHVRQVMPSFFDLHYVFKAYGYLSEQRYETAARAWEQVLQVDPLNVEWLGATATAEFYAGDTARAAELLAVLRRADPNPTPGNESRLLEASLRRDWGAMRKELGRMSSDDPRARARLRALEMLVEERLGVPADDPVWFERPDVVEPGAWERLLGEERPGALHYFARDPAAARQAAQERLALEGPGPPISFWIETIRVGLAAGDEALARRAYEAVRGAQGDHPALDELAGRLGLPASR